MGASSSSQVISQHERKSIPFYLSHSPLSVAMNEGCIEEFSACFELIDLLPNSDLEASKRLPGRSGDFFIIGEGQVDVSVKVPSANKKTGYIREVLCSKKQGDILYVPAVETFAAISACEESKDSILEESQSGVATSSFRRTSAVLYRLLRHRNNKNRSSAVLPENCSLTELGLATSTKANEPKTVFANLSRVKSDQSMNRIEKLLKHLDMTTVTAPYGAILLRLDKNRFDVMESSILRRQKEEFTEDGALIEKKLPWSRHAIEIGNISSSPEKCKKAAESVVSLPDFELMRVMMASNIQDYLKRIPFLTKVPMSRIQMLGEMSQFEVLAKDHTICQEGAQGDRVFVVIFGQLAVYTKKEEVNRLGTSVELRAPASSSSVFNLTSGNQNQSPITPSALKLLGTLGQGDHFGEMSVLADIPRQATVKTKTSCLLISISRAHFRNLMKVVPDVGESVQTVMRLYMLSKFFHSLLYSVDLKNMVQSICLNRNENGMRT